MRPELILVVPIVIGLITLFYLNEEKIRDFLKLPQREAKIVVKEHETDLGTFRRIDDGEWSITLDGKSWQAKDRAGEPDPHFVARIPDIRRVLHVWERNVREEETELDEYAIDFVSQGDTEDEVVLSFFHREDDNASTLFATMRSGEIVDTAWAD